MDTLALELDPAMDLATTTLALVTLDHTLALELVSLAGGLVVTKMQHLAAFDVLLSCCFELNKFVV